MRVAVWGSYAYGNYGDEIMALEFALHLKGLGAHVIVYRLHPSLAERYQIGRAETADELIDGASFCVFGGGSLLSAGKSDAGVYGQQKRREYEELLTALTKHECPLYFSSIGGDGPYSSEKKISSARSALLESPLCRTATVRLEPDVLRLKEWFDLDAVYFPDVLMNVREFWKVPHSPRIEGKVHIGLNLPHSYRGFAALVNSLGRTRRDVVLHYLSTVRPRNKPGQPELDYLPRCDIARIRRHVYTDPFDTLETLNSLDLLISPKLHIGLTAVALGVPYIGIGSSLKSRAFLNSIGADSAYSGNTSTWRRYASVLKLVMLPDRIRELRQLFDNPTIEKQRRESYGHLTTLSAVYQNYCHGRRQMAVAAVS